MRPASIEDRGMVSDFHLFWGSTVRCILSKAPCQTLENHRPYAARIA